jgi:aminoglycoside 6-adenylyltransferase
MPFSALDVRLKENSYKTDISQKGRFLKWMKPTRKKLWHPIYVARYLWRDDMMAAKYAMENFMRHEHLLPMLEWHLELENDWSVKTGLYGRRLKKWLRPDLWADLEKTYTGA